MLNPTPTNDTTVRPFHVRTGNSGVIFSWCDDTQKFSPCICSVYYGRRGSLFQFPISAFNFSLNCQFTLLLTKFLWFRSYQCATNQSSFGYCGIYLLLSVDFCFNYQFHLCEQSSETIFVNQISRSSCSCWEVFQSFNYLSSTNYCWFPTVVGIILWMKVWIPTVVIWIILWMKVWIPTVLISDKEEPQTVERSRTVCFNFEQEQFPISALNFSLNCPFTLLLIFVISIVRLLWMLSVAINWFQLQLSILFVRAIIRNYFRHSDFEKPFNYLSSTNINKNHKLWKETTYGATFKKLYSRNSGRLVDTQKVRIFRKCLISTPWTILQFALSCTRRYCANGDWSDQV